MRTGLPSVIDTEYVTLGNHIDTWENEDGSTAYGYDEIVLEGGLKTPNGAVMVSGRTGEYACGDLVRIENIPIGHRHHTHEQWEIGPIRSIWAVPGDVDEDGRTQEVETTQFDPEDVSDWPGVSIVAEVYAPRLGGDVPLNRCALVNEPPEIYTEHLGENSNEGIWVNEPIQKSGYRDDHLPDAEDDDRETTVITTAGSYDSLVKIRKQLYELPASDSNAGPNAPETDRVSQVILEDDCLRVELYRHEDKLSGKQRLDDVVEEFDADVTHTETSNSQGITDDIVKEHYRVTV